MALHPDAGHVAEHEADGSAGLYEHAGRDQLLHHHAGDGRAHRELRADGGALLLGLVDLLRGDAENPQRLETVLHVGEGVVVIRLGAFHVFDGDRAARQQVFLAVHDALVEDFAIARLAIRRDGVHHIGAGNVKQRISGAYFDAGIHQDARNRAVDLGDGLGGMVGIPIHGAGGVHGDLPISALHRHDLEVRHLVLRDGKQGRLNGRRPFGGLSLDFFQISAGDL